MYVVDVFTYATYTLYVSSASLRHYGQGRCILKKEAQVKNKLTN